jgi:hypothetical protein
MSEGFTEVTAPMLWKFSMGDISTFLNARAAYEHALDDKNALLRSNQKIPSRSIRASIDPAVLEILCELGLNGFT